MSRIILNIIYATVCLSLLLVCCLSLATEVYISNDEYGRLHYSDTPPDAPHRQERIEIENNYKWSDPPAYQPPGKTRSKKKPGKQAKKYTLTELKSRCHAARGKYNTFRTTGRNIDWDTYRARLENYKADRDEWCGRLLRGR